MNAFMSKTIVFLMIAGSLISGVASAADCDTYKAEFARDTHEIQQTYFVKVGAALISRRSGDRMYLGCFNAKDGKCERIGMVLEAISCSTDTSPRYFDLNSKTDLSASSKSDLENSMDLNAQDMIIDDHSFMYPYIGATLDIAAMSYFFPPFVVLIPVGAAADVALFPVRLTFRGVEKVERSVWRNKSGKVFTAQPGLDQKVIRKYFKSLVELFAGDKIIIHG